ncbi:hypothetical protein ABXJ76_18755 [Methylobacter sp. G7]|uniref:hypothetical protein n=1 Tax=Methylobacter sp. G7 TaxID=3230117 RepID=UPI003D804C47
MTHINPPVQSLKSLIIASAFALLLAVIILLSAVLPAEYGIDPTGMGKMMGLSALSAPTNDGNKALAITCPVLPPQTINQAAGSTETIQKEPLPQWQDSVKIIVPAGEGLEYKFHLVKGATLDYSWTTDGAKLYFDFHGEPKGDKTGYFKSFKESSDNQSTGILTAPFEGPHGWYWENKTRSPVAIILNTKGSYRILGLL